MRDLTLSDFPFVASLGDSDNPNDRRIWLRVACDHFVATGTTDGVAIERFADAIVARIKTADLPTVLDAARKLAPCPRTPVRLLAQFQAIGPEVSDAVLEHGAALGVAELGAAIKRGGREATAVARRADLSARLIDALVALNEIEPLVALASNPQARLEGAVFGGLLRRARTLADDHDDRRLAAALLERRPVRPENAALFLIADPIQRVEILLAMQRAQLGRPPGLPPVTSEIVDELELAAVARRPERFVAVLADALDCDPMLAARIAGDASGEPLAVAMAALGAPSDVLVRVLIANDLESGRQLPAHPDAGPAEQRPQPQCGRGGVGGASRRAAPAKAPGAGGRGRADAAGCGRAPRDAGRWPGAAQSRRVKATRPRSERNRRAPHPPPPLRSACQQDFSCSLFGVIVQIPLQYHGVAWIQSTGCGPGAAQNRRLNRTGTGQKGALTGQIRRKQA